MKTYNNIEELFELAKSQAPLINKQKAAELVKIKSATHSKSNIKHIAMKIILVSSVILSTMIGLHFMGFNPLQHSNNPIVKNQVNTEISNPNTNTFAEKRESRESRETVQAETTTSLSNKNISGSDSEKVNTPIPQKNSTNKNDSPLLPFIENLDISNSKPLENDTIKTVKLENDKNNIDKNKCIVLNKQELAALGIYVKEGNIMFEKEKTPWGKTSAHFLKDNSFSYSVSREGINSKGNNPIPHFASSSDGKLLFRLYVLSEKEKSISIEDCERMTPDLLPIWVDMDEGDFVSVILWYKNDKHLLEILPERIGNQIKNNPTLFSVQANFEEISEKESEKINVVKDIKIDPNQIIDPDKELLQKLGIKNVKGINYKRKAGTCVIKINISNGMHKFETTFCHKQTESTKINSIIPSYVTVKNNIGNISITSFRKNGFEQNERHAFINEQDNMIAIRVQKESPNNEEVLFWYQYNNAIAKELNPNDKAKIDETLKTKKDMKLDNITLNSQGEKRIPYADIAFNDNTEGTHIKDLTLKKEELSSLGISIKNKQIVYAVPSIKNERFSVNEIVISKYGTELNLIELKDKPDTSKFVLPVLITDISGNYMRLSFDNQIDLKKVNLSSLIPVKVLSGDTYSAEDKIKKRHHPDLIFWYEPNEKFLSILDVNKAEEIKNDIEIMVCIQNNQNISKEAQDTCELKKEMSCNHFESCQNNIQQGITGYSLYPNPASDYLNIKLNISKESKVSINLYTINGQLVQELVINKAQAGILQEKLAVKSLAPGIYLLHITTDNGDKIVERIIIGE